MTQAQPRIDLNHGYMRFIRRNQVDRDEFDRCHERRKSEIRERLEKTPSRANIYVPPHLRPKKRIEHLDRSLSRSDSDSQEEQKQHDEIIRNQVRRRIERTHATVDDICISLANYSLREAEIKNEEKNSPSALFTLQITLKDGEKKSIKVAKNTQAARLAKCIAREHDFTDSQCRNLRIFLEEQLETRLARSTTSSEVTTSESEPTSPCSTIASFSSSSSA